MTLNPSRTHVSIMWSNNGAYTRAMTRYGVNLPNDPLDCAKLHLDQVHIIYRPTADISSFTTGDDNTKTWRAETSQLYVRTTPGDRHTLYAVSSTNPVNESSASTNVVMPVTYSSALTVVPDTEGSEDLWCRTYRPIRDLPVATDVRNCRELIIELLFPLLMADHRTTLTQIPDYRIIKVLCEFSLDKND